jgi:hypothetical protein
MADSYVVVSRLRARVRTFFDVVVPWFFGQVLFQQILLPAFVYWLLAAAAIVVLFQRLVLGLVFLGHELCTSSLQPAAPLDYYYALSTAAASEEMEDETEQGEGGDTFHQPPFDRPDEDGGDAFDNRQLSDRMQRMWEAPEYHIFMHYTASNRAITF